jgi:HNH endonuclease
MEHFIAYHSVKRMGSDYGSSGELDFLSKKLGVLKQAIGNNVWVIKGIPSGKISSGRKTDFFLCGVYIADTIEGPTSDIYIIRGTQGTDFVPPVPLNQLSWFPALLKKQSNFSLGFNRISDESVILGLSALHSESNTSEFAPSLPDIDFSAAVSEGGRRMVSHLKRERSRFIVEAKKAAVLNLKGSLSCEVCGFDFSVTYGSLGEGFCEVHHLSPLSASNESVKTTLDDLAVVCSNCHRIIHRSDPMLSVAELSKVIRDGRL